MSPYLKYQGVAEPNVQGNSSGDAPFTYRPSSEESTPLVPGRIQRKASPGAWKRILYGIAVLLVVLFATINLYLHLTRCPLYPSTMDAIRLDWEKELGQQVLLREEWQLERQEHVIIEEEWKLEAEWHERDVERRDMEENERQERVQREWAQEYERHLHEVEEHRHQYEEMERCESERRESERQKWRREMEDHDRIVEERRKREEEERQKLDMYWAQVKAHTCTTYGTREYTAQLMNLPDTWEHRVDACKATPLQVHGISYSPKSCDDKGPGVVIGHWEIDQHEPDCAAFWNRYKDKGCTSPGSGRRRIEHYLENLPMGSDWREFCATTPARFNGLEFSGAQECFQSKSGTYGHWQIDDSRCQ